MKTCVASLTLLQLESTQIQRNLNFKQTFRRTLASGYSDARQRKVLRKGCLIMGRQVAIKGLRGAVILHRCLVAGLFVMSGVIALLVFLRTAPLLPHDETALLIGKVMAGVSLCQLVLGLVIFRPRMPEFRRSHAGETYWDSPGSLEAAQKVWFFIDGAGITSLVGFLLTGDLAPAVTATIAIAAMLLSGPGRLTRS